MDGQERRYAAQFLGRSLLGLVLIAAVALKADSDARMPASPSGNFFRSRAFVRLVLITETLTGSALVAGIDGRNFRRVCILMFAAFGFVAVTKVIHAEDSCGCFGAIPVPPWATATFDLTAAAFLAITRPAEGRSLHERRAYVVFLMLISLVASISIWLELRVRPADDIRADDAFGALVLLAPAKWIDKPLPIAHHIDVGDQIVRGRWIALLVHHDCDHCASAVPFYIAAFRQDRPNVAIIEMPPFGDVPWTLDGASAIRGRLDNQRTWFAATPVAILLQDGVVRAVAEGDSAMHPPADW